MIKKNSLPRKQKKLSQNIKKFVAKISAEDFKILKLWTAECYF